MAQNRNFALLLGANHRGALYAYASPKREGGSAAAVAEVVRPYLTKDQRSARQVRLKLDIVPSLTDAQALSMFWRLSGYAPGAVSDLVAW